MSNSNHDATVRALAAQKPATRAGLVRSLIPQIEVALQCGHTITTVWKAVRQEDKGFSYKLFCLYLQRIRSKNVKPTARTGPEKTELKSPQNSEPQLDPLANLKLAETTRSGFYYRGTENLEELIHGRKDRHGKQKHGNR